MERNKILKIKIPLPNYDVEELERKYEKVQLPRKILNLSGVSGREMFGIRVITTRRGEVEISTEEESYPAVLGENNTVYLYPPGTRKVKARFNSLVFPVEREFLFDHAKGLTFERRMTKKVTTALLQTIHFSAFYFLACASVNGFSRSKITFDLLCNAREEILRVKNKKGYYKGYVPSLIFLSPTGYADLIKEGILLQNMEKKGRISPIGVYLGTWAGVDVFITPLLDECKIGKKTVKAIIVDPSMIMVMIKDKQAVYLTEEKAYIRVDYLTIIGDGRAVAVITK